MKVYLSDIETLGGAGSFDALLQTLPECRRQKVLRLKRDDARRRSLGAGLLLAKALSPFGLTEADAVTGPYGKPCFPGGAGPCFSLSHSGSRVMCAVSACEIGCDVEMIRYRRDTDGIARRYFAPEERLALGTVSGETERKKLFFRYWTLKESFLKTTGRGLSLPLDRFCIRLSDEGVSVSPAGGDPAVSGRYDLREFFFGDGYCYALCCAGGIIPKALEPEWVVLGEAAD